MQRGISIGLAIPACASIHQTQTCVRACGLPRHDFTEGHHAISIPKCIYLPFQSYDSAVAVQPGACRRWL